MKNLSRAQKPSNISAVVVLAPHWQRVIAFMLDAVLIFSLSSLLLNAFILPEKFPDALVAIEGMTQQVAHAIQSGTYGVDYTVDENLEEAIAFIRAFIYFFFLGYFFLSELCFRGASIGKKMFGIQVVNAHTLQPVHFFEALMRSGMKGMLLILFFPLLFIDYAVCFFDRQRRTAHDMLCQTLVIAQLPPAPVEDEDEDESFD